MSAELTLASSADAPRRGAWAIYQGATGIQVCRGDPPKGHRLLDRAANYEEAAAKRRQIGRTAGSISKESAKEPAVEGAMATDAGLEPIDPISAERLWNALDGMRDAGTLRLQRGKRVIIIDMTRGIAT